MTYSEVVTREVTVRDNGPLTLGVLRRFLAECTEHGIGDWARITLDQQPGMNTLSAKTTADK